MKHFHQFFNILKESVKRENIFKKEFILYPHFNLGESILNLLKEEGHDLDYEVIEKYSEKSDKKYLKIFLGNSLKYLTRKSGILEKVSVKDLIKFNRGVDRNKGYFIITTPKGLKTHSRAILENNGGYLLFYANRA